MFSILVGLIVMLIGTGGGLAWAATTRQGVATHLERVGGALLIAGLALLAYALRQIG